MSRRGKLYSLFALSALLFGLSVPAQASLVGYTFEVGYYTPNDSTLYNGASPNPTSFTVGSSSATLDIEGVTDITVSGTANTFNIVFDTVLPSPTWGSADFNGIILSLVGPGSIDPIAAVSSSNISGFGISRVGQTPNSLSFNWQGLSYSDGATITATLVPIPAAAWLFGSALLGLGVVARRRDARAPAAGA